MFRVDRVPLLAGRRGAAIGHRAPNNFPLNQTVAGRSRIVRLSARRPAETGAKAPSESRGRQDREMRGQQTECLPSASVCSRVRRRSRGHSQASSALPYQTRCSLTQTQDESSVCCDAPPPRDSLARCWCGCWCGCLNVIEGRRFALRAPASPRFLRAPLRRWPPGARASSHVSEPAARLS
jgi:hypothetical protein